jgi:transposase
MDKFKPINRIQSFLLPPSVEDFVKEDHLAKVVGEVVEHLDTSKMEERYSTLGQKSYHPKLLLKLLFYGYCIGMRSGRKIAAACESDVAFMYLACMYRPDFRTINDFRKDNVDQVEKLFVDVVKLCSAMKMVKMGTLVIDSTKLRANASSRKSKTKEQYEQWLSSIENQTKEILAQADDADKEEDEKYGDKRGDELPEEINTKSKLKKRLEEAIAQLKEGEKQNFTDPDAKIIKGSGRFQTNYNCQTSCTTEGIIVSAYATNAASDKEQLTEIVTQAQSNTAQRCETILADSGYASYENYEQLKALNIVTLIPDQEKEIEAHKASTDPYHRNHFNYDQEQDIYTCPQGKSLLPLRDFQHKRNKQKGKIYQCTECNACHQKEQCTKGNFRQLHVEERMPLRQTIRQLLDSAAGKKLYKLRQQIIEPIFGHLKYNLKYTMLSVRTLKKADAEWKLICLAHNIRHIWKAKHQLSI